VLDQGYDIQNFDPKFRSKNYFYEFQYSHTDVPDRRRDADRVTCDKGYLDSIEVIHGGMSRAESTYLHLLTQAIPHGAIVTNVGVWRGSSAIVLLDALAGKRATFHFIDCFDLAGVSEMSAQPPATRDEFVRNIEPYVGRAHIINIVRANTLDLNSFPRSDFIFVDGGHTQECISNDVRLASSSLTPHGVAAFHDYGCPVWPAVKPALDAVFARLEVFETVAVYRKSERSREAYQWASIS
jgi:hypothetical protein